MRADLWTRIGIDHYTMMGVNTGGIGIGIDHYPMMGVNTGGIGIDHYIMFTV